MGSNGLQMSREAFLLLRQFVYEKSGMFFADNKQYLLETRLADRLRARGCATYEDYYHFLRYDSLKEKELASLYDLVTTNETSFFRDMPQLKAFEDGVLLQLIAGKEKAEDRRLRFWSAACSTGEEPYTLAIQLLERLPPNKGWQVEILASDISEAALSAARRGVYGQYAVRNVPEGILKKYFTTGDGTYAVSPEVRRFVRFTNLNLFDSGRLRIVRGMDVVFCRNVLIYFDDEAKRKVVGSLYDTLQPGGYLFIGHSESLHNISRAFKLVTVSRSLVYQKA